MEYWNSLPFQGWHYPDHLRISDGRYKNLDERNEKRLDDAHARKLQWLERIEARKKETDERNERKRIEQAKKTAEYKAKVKAEREAVARRCKEEFAGKQERLKKLAEARKQAAEAKALAKMLGLPMPKPKRPPKTYTPEQIEARRQRTREWQKAHRKTDPDKRLLGKPVRVTRKDGTVVVHPSITVCARVEHHDKTTIRRILATGIPYTYPNGDTVQYDK